MMKERGFTSRYIQFYNSKTQVKCSTSLIATAVHLEYSDVYIAFLIILIGYAASLLICIMEKLLVIYSPKIQYYFSYYLPVFYRIDSVSLEKK